MADLTDDQLAALDEAFADVRSTLRAAAGSLQYPAWEQHSAAVADATEAAQIFYLHTTSDGVVHEPTERVFLKRDAPVAGLYPALVKPLVAFLRRQTTRLNKAYSSKAMMPPPDEQSAWLHWVNSRLPYFETVVAEEDAKGSFSPSERLWTEVTAPLVQGNFTGEHWTNRGISNPGHRDQDGNWIVRPTRPDLAYPATVYFMTAEYNEDVGRLQAWLTENVTDVDIWLDETSAAARAWLERNVEKVKAALEDELGPIIEKAKRVFLYTVIALIVIAGIYAIFRARRAELASPPPDNTDPKGPPNE